MNEWRWRCYNLRTSTAQDLKERYFGLSILMPGMKNPRMPFDRDPSVAVVDVITREAWVTAAEEVKSRFEVVSAPPADSAEISRRVRGRYPKEQSPLSTSPSIWSIWSPGIILREAAALCFLGASDGDALLIDLKELLKAPNEIAVPPDRLLCTEAAERPKIDFMLDSTPMCGGRRLSAASTSGSSCSCNAAEAVAACPWPMSMIATRTNPPARATK